MCEPIAMVDGKRDFRGLPLVTHTLDLGRRSDPQDRGIPGGMRFEIEGLADAAALLDFPDFARRFTDENIAPYGLELWPAAKMLTEYVIADEPGDGRRAIELGCGLGLVSIAASRCGWHVTATDNDETSLTFARDNARRNGARLAGVKPLDWNNPPTDTKYERVFAADVLYERFDHQPLLACVRQLLAPSGVAIVADPNRRIADTFGEAADTCGFDVAFSPAKTHNHGGELVLGRIFRMTRSSAFQGL